MRIGAENHIGTASFSSHWIKGTISAWLTGDDGKLVHLAETVLVSFLHCKISLMPFGGKSQSTAHACLRDEEVGSTCLQGEYPQ